MGTEWAPLIMHLRNKNRRPQRRLWRAVLWTGWAAWTERTGGEGPNVHTQLPPVSSRTRVGLHGACTTLLLAGNLCPVKQVIPGQVFHWGQRAAWSAVWGYKCHLVVRAGEILLLFLGSLLGTLRTGGSGEITLDAD